MFRNQDQMRQRLRAIIETFRQKGATTPEKAMTIQELGLPPRFEEAMHRRLGQTGIFVEVNGKYYLSEERLKQIQEQRQKTQGGGGGGGFGRTGPPAWSRYVGVLLMLPIGLIAAVALFYFFGSGGIGFFPGEFLIILIVIMVGVAIVRMLFWRSRRRYWREQIGAY